MSKTITMTDLLEAAKGNRDYGNWAAAQYCDRYNQESREQIEQLTWIDAVSTYAADDTDPVTLLYAGEWDGRTQWDEEN